MGYPPERGRLSTRYSPVRHFTRPANRAFSCDLHVLGMPPALILSQDQTLQFYLEFSRTRAHYLVFKEQVLLINIVSTFSPLSSSLFVARGLLPLPLRPPSGTCFCNQSQIPCQAPFSKKVAGGPWPVCGWRTAALGCSLPSGDTGVWWAQAFQPVHLTLIPPF